ncbi:helix-turn-helix transcriptional regulator [Sodalis ligni]|nr:helix-turn-helix transcriptional regulator [Sodalis ligni]
MPAGIPAKERGIPAGGHRHGGEGQSRRAALFESRRGGDDFRGRGFGGERHGDDFRGRGFGGERHGDDFRGRDFGGERHGDDFRGRGFGDERRCGDFRGRDFGGERHGDDFRGRGFGDERRCGDFRGRGFGGDFHGRGRGEDRAGGHFGHGRDSGGRHDGDHRGRRPLEHGDLRLVLLALVARKPSHGYELIKAIEQASSGLYVPSPGVIYPTLSLLVDQDFINAASPDGQSRKIYQITAEGQAELAKHQPLIDAVFTRLSQIGRRREGSLLPGISESLDRLRGLLRGNMMRADLTPEQVERINNALLTAVKNIEAELMAAPDAGAAQD